jgi:hypothetical protein
MRPQSPFPTRGLMDMLESPVIKSDDEFDSEWRSKLASMSPTIETPGVQLVNGAQGFNAQTADPYRNTINDAVYNNYVSSYGDVAPEYAAGLRAVADYARGAGVAVSKDGGYDGAEVGISVNPYTDPGGLLASSQGFSHYVGGGESQANPAYAAAKAAWDAERAKRLENNTRQQQAYDTTLNGNNAWGGVLPENYADPNYGMVTGQQPSASNDADIMSATEGGLGGLGGFPTGPTGPTSSGEVTGAYKGQAGVFSPLKRTEQGYGPTWGAKGWGS